MVKTDTDTAHDIDWLRTRNAVAESHSYRTEEMEKLAKKTYQGVCDKCLPS